MKEKKKIELKQLNRGWWVLNKDDLFTSRKKALIARDPLTKDLLDKLASYNPRTGKPTDEEMDELKQRIEKKWNVGIVVTWAAQPHLHGVNPIKEAPQNLLSPVKMKFSENETLTEDPLLIFDKTRGYPVSSVPSNLKCLLPIDPTEGYLTIQINLDLIDKNDRKDIRDAVWAIVEQNLKKKEAKLPWEPQELKFIFDCYQDTFDRYLRWYDLNIGTDYNKPNGYTFRAIALGEYVLRNHPELYDSTMKGIANRTKVVRSTRGERVLKGIVGEPVKEEDTVGKGVKIIYKAIHRRPYPSKKTKLKEYNCPRHGV